VGGAVAGLLRALRRELPNLRVKLLDTEPSEAAAAVAEALLRELDSEDARLEAGLLRGDRRVLRLVSAPVRIDPARLDALAALPYVVLTGGGRGITAEVALRLARAGVRRFHLLGRTALPPQLDEWRALDHEGRDRLRQEVLERLRKERGRVTPAEWEQAMAPVARALEVGDTLRRLGEAGASARYHAVDVADRAALAAVLRSIRAEDGPLEALVHGAGFERSRAFVSQQPSDWRATLDAKADGTLNLALLTVDDPLRFFVTFGSVAGRFGGLGQADYSLACELQSRLAGLHAAERPGCRTLAIGWPAWDDVGMAARGDVRERLRARGRRLMPAAEGVEHFVAELAAARRRWPTSMGARASTSTACFPGRPSRRPVRPRERSRRPGRSWTSCAPPVPTRSRTSAAWMPSATSS
jgi:NAD(P)-dependent dehydrogenase (short-subunit alcohol dehydrogenase family)